MCMICNEHVYAWIFWNRILKFHIEFCEMPIGIFQNAGQIFPIGVVEGTTVLQHKISPLEVQSGLVSENSCQVLSLVCLWTYS